MLILAGCGTGPSNGLSDQELLSLKSKCRQDGERVRQEWQRTYFQDVFSDEPQYVYNRQLKTCLWLGEYTGPSLDSDDATSNLISVQTHVKFILDVYTNKTLIEYTEHNGKPIGEVTEAAFVQRKAELFDAR